MEALLVNRTQTTSLRALEEASVLLPWESPATQKPGTSRALDLTGTLRDESSPDTGATKPRRASEPVR